MAEGFAFDEEMAAAMERIYTTDSIAKRRRWIREQLDPAPGSAVLSVGTGPGFEARGLGEAVGPDGRVLGVDVEDAMLAVARERCADQSWVAFECGDAADLPVADGTFDGALGVQVYEYVPDVTAAFVELHRVLRPAGRVAVFDSDWSTLTWHAEDADLASRIVSAFDAHCPHPRLARTVAPRLRAAGFEVVDSAAFTHFETRMDGTTFGGTLAPLVGDFAATQGGVPPAEVEAWVGDLRERAAAGEYFFSFSQYLFVGEKPREEA